MTLIVPHRILSIQSHPQVRYLARFRCLCGVVGYSTPDLIQQAATAHIESEEAWPDYSFLADDPTQPKG